MSYSTAIVVGASSGIGENLVCQLAESGCKVAAVARRKELLDALVAEFPGKVLAYPHDVTNFDEVPKLFAKITQELGGLDLIIYAAGVMPAVAETEFNFEKDREMVDVNVLGAIAWLNQAATRFENTQSGTIVGIGSVAGDRGRQGQPVYNTTKAALATYMEALRNRLAKKGVKVVTIKPGPTETPMTANLKGKMMKADTAAKLILEKSNKTGEHYLKPVHWLIFLIIRNIPSPVFRKLKV
ncbi:MAG: SDR family NAD(P)-dependent oxidoreductase [Armatimonadetes bacterium]|nr:SDR family NAD(P)-dependent oxidoreductase [Armatimonadota bacterium]